MSKGEQENRSNRHSGALDKLAPFDDRNQYEQRLKSLPAEQKEFAEESTRFADLCQYFSQQKMDIPPSVVERVGSISKLSVPDRIRAMKDINRELMEYLNDVGQDPGIRQ
ncbi:MAG: hypothetical protein WA172_11250 [Terriglobales bacterium]